MTDLPRNRGLDAMRVLVVVGLIFFHAALIFDTRDDYYVKNQHTADLSPVAALGVVWAMPLLFLTAGLAAWHSLGRRTGAEFIRERARRLLVPLVFGVLVLMPIPVWFRLRGDPAYHQSYLQFYPEFLHVRLDWGNSPFVLQGTRPDELFETGQLWFVVLLLTFSLLLLPLFLWLRGERGAGTMQRLRAAVERRGVILVPAIPLAVVTAALGMEEPYAAWSRWAYLLFFACGFVLAGDPRFVIATRRNVRSAAILGVLAFLAALALLSVSKNSGGDPFVDHRLLSVIGRLCYGAAGWCWLVAIIGLLSRVSVGRRARQDPSRAVRVTGYLSQSVLPVYILHQPVLVAIAFYVVRWPVPAVVKYLVICAATLVSVFAIYDLLVRRTRVTRFLFGMRTTPRAGAERAVGPIAHPVSEASRAN